jgi:hypothetical protein
MKPNFEKFANDAFDARIRLTEKITGREFTDKDKWRKLWIEIYAKNEDIITKAAEKALEEIWKEDASEEDEAFFERLELCNKGNGIEID